MPASTKRRRDGALVVAVQSCETCKHWRHKASVLCQEWGVCDSHAAGQHIRVFGAQFARSVMVNHGLPQADIQEVVETLDIRVCSSFGCIFWEQRP